MSAEQKHLDKAEAVVDLKEVEAAIVTKFEELNEEYKTALGQINDYGEANEETKGKIGKLTEDYDALYDRVQEIEQKGVTSRNVEEWVSLGQQFAEDEQVEQMREGKMARARMEVKTAIVNATGASQPLVPADRQMGIWATPNRMLTIRDLIPSSPTDSNLVEFTREASFTNSAAAQGAGSSPEVWENVTKAESGITFSLVSEPVITLAHFIPASRQVLDDAAGLTSHINNRLMYGLKLYEETQILSGDGTSHQLNGLITQATAFANESPLLTNEIDMIRSAIKQSHVGEYRPDFLVLNPQDWFDIEIRKVGTSDDRYVVGNPANMMAPNLWALPVVVTNSIASGSFLMGSSFACEIKDRQQAAVEMSREDSDNFRKNMVTVLAEERITLCVYRTEAFITGNL